MLPIHRVLTSVFNYDEIPAGYYYQVMQNGGATQRFWHRKKFEEIAARIPDGSRVLDFGCGPGSFLSILGQQKPGVRAIGLDVASPQIDFAQKEIASQFPDGRIQFQRQNLEEPHLPFEDASFDCVTSIEVIEHIHPYLAFKMLQEAKRLIKKDGKVIVTTPNYRSFWPFIEWLLEKLSPVKYHDQHISKFTPNSLVKFLEAAGFEVLNLDTIYVASPFVAPLSWNLAEGLHRAEKKSGLRLGSLLVAECRPFDF